jgi:hypothetical protein
LERCCPGLMRADVEEPGAWWEQQIAHPAP